MRLSDLQPTFIRVAAPTGTDVLSNAQGMRMLCPRCFRRKNGPVGVHSVELYFANRGVPEAAGDALCRPRRWVVRGTGFSDLSLRPEIGIPSCGYSGLITNGEVSE